MQLGPPIGGLLYSYLGFSYMFVALCLIPFTQCIFLPFVARRIPPPSTTIDPHTGAATITTDTTTTNTTTSRSWREMMVLPVLMIALTGLTTNMALGYLDTLVGPHLERVLGVGPQGVGIIIMVPSLVFTIISAFAGEIIPHLGYKKVGKTPYPLPPPPYSNPLLYVCTPSQNTEHMYRATTHDHLLLFDGAITFPGPSLPLVKDGSMGGTDGCHDNLWCGLCSLHPLLHPLRQVLPGTYGTT